MHANQDSEAVMELFLARVQSNLLRDWEMGIV
jgi:hypothetical protein